MINNVVLTGRLTKEIDLRYTSTGTAVGTFNLAVERQFKTQNGERETDFVNCVIWRKAAENLANFTRKGSLVGIQGRIQTRNYENQNGQRVYVTEVVVENFTLLEPRSVTEQRDNNASRNEQKNNYKQNDFNQKREQESPYNTSDDPFVSSGQSIDISDDDLPF
ncbi:MAG TPA: single-stranded DNA-binding protein [Candidatus Jeotgalibaca merdavium]|uniref:Single-stranded DNA-binding protein n=1 Tax=Candidatus Jeotgalibaca merdavium TaxID=2838627 RepID=A0A9D2KYI7_9LACT|nr:single-stranded DNA-binding protein [Candidatus Jeotgalibaca merdavium]